MTEGMGRKSDGDGHLICCLNASFACFCNPHIKSGITLLCSKYMHYGVKRLYYIPSYNLLKRSYPC